MGWGVGVTFAAVVLSEVGGGVGGVFVFFEDVGRCCGDDVFDVFGRRCDGTGS